MPLVRSLLTVAALAANGVTTQAAEACLTPNGETLRMTMPKQSDMVVTVPPIPTETVKYRYATDNALVAIPKACVDTFHLTPNFADRSPGPSGMRYFRVSDPEAQYAELAKMAECACGLAIVLHGSSGATWDSVAYSRMMAGLGYVVVLPDSMAMPESMGLKSRRPLKSTDQINTTDYWGVSNPYDGDCSGFSMPFCYSTAKENILHDPANYREYVERNYLIRKLELDYFVESQLQLLDAFEKVFLIGRSEGALVTGRYYHPELDKRLSGVIHSGWSCDFNYFVSCADHAKVCGGKCRKDMPQLNLVGQHDLYFGTSDSSVSEGVSQASRGYGGPITGNCREAFDKQGFQYGTVVVFPDAPHCFSPKFDNEVRSIFADFVNGPSHDPSSWPSLRTDYCTETGGVYSCMDPGDGKMVHDPTWNTDVVDSWAFIGTTNASCCSQTGTVTTPSRSLYASAGLAVVGLLACGIVYKTAAGRHDSAEYASERGRLLQAESA